MPMIKPGPISWILAAFVLAVLLWSDRFPDRKPFGVTEKQNRIFCAVLFAAGCLLRLWNLAGLPAGISAEEALVGIQAKSLWQTGGFFGAGGLTTQLPQWTGDSAGPMLAVLTAPFVGLFGMNTLTVRLPLALLSCCAMPAAWGTGRKLGGERGGRTLLMIYALCPFFVLTARLTASASLSVSLLPIALYFAVCGLDRDAFLAAACGLTVMLCYAQDLYFFLSPALLLVLFAGVLLHRKGKRTLGPVLFCLAGLLLCVPGILTVYACREGGQDIRVLGLLCPHLESFDKAENFFATLSKSLHPDREMFNRIWKVLCGGFFQDVMHLNIAGGLFFPDGMTALNLFSVLLALAGALLLITRRTQGRKTSSAARLLLTLGLAFLAIEMFFGSKGLDEIMGTTSVWDFAQLFPFTAMLMLPAIAYTERRSRIGTLSLTGAFVLGGILTGIWLFGGGYKADSNVYFPQLAEAISEASAVREKTGAKVEMTNSVYPHIEPDSAAEIILLYGSDADMKEASRSPETYGEIAWFEGEEARTDTVYVLTRREVSELLWNEDDFEARDVGTYTVLIPKNGSGKE